MNPVNLSQRRKDAKKPIGTGQKVKGNLFLLLAIAYWLLAVSVYGEAANSPSLGGIISGLVQDQTGNPVVGARVEARRLSGSLSGDNSVTNYEGRYHLDSLPAGAYEIVVLPPEDSFLAIRREILGVLNGLTTRYDFTLREGGGIKGWVAGPSGEPVERLTIKLQKNGRIISVVITDAEGLYQFRNIPPDEYELRFEFPQAEIPGTLKVIVKPEKITTQNTILNIEKPPLGSIAGRVETESGMPIPQANIYVRGLNGMIQTDLEGDFHITNLPSKTYTLIIVPPNELPLVKKRITVSVLEGETIIRKIILEKAGRILGQVRDEKGEPVADAYIEVNLRDANNNFVDRGSALSDLKGQYSINDLIPGDYKLDVQPPDSLNLLNEQLSGVEVLSGSDTNKDMTLSVGGIISGTVTDEEGQPVPDVRIQANETEIYTDSEGQYTIIGLPPVSYTLKLLPPKGRNLLPLTRDNIEATTGLVNTQNFTLKAGGVVTGTVSDPDENPIANLEVKIEDDFLGNGEGRIVDIPGSEAKIWIFESQVNLKTTTDHEGSYRFDTLPPGDYRIRISPPEALPFKGTEERGISLSLSETVIKEFTLLPTNLIRGKVIDHSKGAGQRRFIVGAEETGRPIRWSLEYLGRDRTQVKKDLSYQIKDLSPGTYNLYLLLESVVPYYSLSRIRVATSPEITLSPTQVIDNQDFEVDLGVGGGLSGRITGWPGNEGLVAALSPEGSLVGSTLICHDGRYILAPLPEGEYTVVATTEDDRSAVRSGVLVVKGVIMANIDLDLGSPKAESGNILVLAGFNLDQVKAYPNPFYPGQTESCTITGIPPAAKEITFNIYTITGELVKSFEADELVTDSFGSSFGNCVKWDGHNDHGRRCASGIYIYYLKCGRQEKVGKIALVR